MGTRGEFRKSLFLWQVLAAGGLPADERAREQVEEVGTVDEAGGVRVNFTRSIRNSSWFVPDCRVLRSGDRISRRFRGGTGCTPPVIPWLVTFHGFDPTLGKR
jgi:hypothetical protein